MYKNTKKKPLLVEERQENEGKRPRRTRSKEYESAKWDQKGIYIKKNKRQYAMAQAKVRRSAAFVTAEVIRKRHP